MEKQDKAAFLKRKLQDAKQVLSAKAQNEPQHGLSPSAQVETRQLGVPKAPSVDDEENFTMTHAKGDQKFMGRTLHELLFVEILAGTARLSKIAREHGIGILPVDKTAARASQVFIANYDMTNPEEVAVLKTLLETEKERILATRLAPTFETASKAREKKLVSVHNKGFKVLVPVRSNAKPSDHLAGLDKIRTEAVNIVYSATADIIKFCIKWQILCLLENPENSLFWDYPEIAEILQENVGFSVDFHHCMHGGTRNKKTRWWSTQDVFHPLTAFCKGKKMRPLVSEFQAYCSFLSEPALEPESNSFFKQQPKGSRVVHRQLQWGRIRVDGTKVFWQTETKETEPDDKTLQEFFDLEGKQSQAELCTEYQGNPGISLRKLQRRDTPAQGRCI